MRKILTGASVVFLLLTFFMIGYDSSSWYGKFYDTLYDISIFTPLILGGLGITSAILGIKGNIRVTLITLNSLLFLFCIFATLSGIFGFTEP